MYPSAFPLRGARTIAEAIALLARGRRRGQGAGRRPEPGAAAQAALRLPRAARRHQQPARASTTTGVDDDGTLHVGALCRHVDLERSALLAAQPADDGRGGSADRRPDRAQPRHAGRLAVPRRPAGRLGLGDHRARAARSSRRAPAAGGTIAIAEFVTGPFQNALAYDEVAVEAVVPAAQGTARGRLPQARAPRRRLRDGRRRRGRRASTATGSPAPGIALSGVGGRDHRRHRGRGLARRAGPRRRPRSPAPPTSPPRPPEPRTDHRGSAEYKRHVSTRS